MLVLVTSHTPCWFVCVAGKWTSVLESGLYLSVASARLVRNDATENQKYLLLDLWPIL